MMLSRSPLIFLLSIFTVQVSATTIVISPGVGFDDATLSSSIPNQQGNNPGTTLGEMRMNLFQEAAQVWADILNSNVDITVAALFEDKFCDANSATLGSAGATSSWADFGAGDAGVAYHVALAESLKNSNMNATSVEISAQFNSKVDSDPVCLGGGGFYYGLDGNAPAGTTALFPVVLHELGHGLGFTSISDVQPGGSGKFVGAGGYPDAYSRNLHDLDVGTSWDSMSDAERLASALNEPALVWKGARATADRSLHLGAAPELVINSPGGIAGTFEALLGDEPTIIIPVGGVTANVIDGNNFGDGCSQINEGSFNGKIILFDKSDSCMSATPAFFSEFATNAVGVIIADTTGTGLPDMSGQISNQEITIPYVGVTKSVADDLRANIASANVTIGLSTSKLNGENQGMVKMYAPAAFEQGSSVSHWSRTASPDLLMEPVQGTLEYADVDLTAAAFDDIGWSVNIPGGVLEVIFKDGFE